MDLELLLQTYAQQPAILLLLLFLAPFVLEEAAIVAGAALAAAGQLPAAAVVAALFAGMVISDWMLYALGAGAGQSSRVRGWVGAGNIEYGRRLLSRGMLPAAVSARLVPWLLLPVFVASGFVQVGFGRFAAINAGIALVYTNVLFWGIYGFNLVLFDTLAQWGWVAVAALAAAILLATRAVAKRLGGRRDDQD